MLKNSYDLKVGDAKIHVWSLRFNNGGAPALLAPLLRRLWVSMCVHGHEGTCLYVGVCVYFRGFRIRFIPMGETHLPPSTK